MTLTDFTQLLAWQEAMNLAVEIFEVTKSFPKEERYSLTNQLRRSSQSVAANLAEGFGRYTYPDKRSKYIQARGELVETMSSLHFSKRVQYIDQETLLTFLTRCDFVGKLINGLISRMNELTEKPPKSKVLIPKS